MWEKAAKVHRDLPTSRIKHASAMKTDYGIDITDGRSHSVLITLLENVEPFNYVAIVYGKSDTGKSVQKLMMIDSKYDYVSANKRTLVRELGNKLNDLEIDVIDIGLYYTVDGCKFIDGLACSKRLVIN